MVHLDGIAGARESITGQVSARIARRVMDLVRPLRKRDLALMEREETGGAGMKEVTGTWGCLWPKR